MVENSSIRKVCDEIGISKSTVSDRFKKNGYTYDVEEKKYVKDTVKEIKSNKNITKLDNKDTKDNNLVTPAKVNENENKNESKNKNDLRVNDIKELIELKDDIKKLIEIHKEDNNKKELRIRGFEGSLSVKTMKVYDEVLDDFMEFVGKNKELKQQEIITQALWEFLQKYK